MDDTTYKRGPETVDPPAGLTDEDLDEFEKDPAFQRMADAADRAEREGKFTPHEEVRNPPRPDQHSNSRS